MAVQPFIRRGMRSNATARRLVAASMQMSPSVIRATVERDDIKQPVMRCLALDDTIEAGVRIYAGQHFYLVASAKFPGRFYVLVRNGRDWKCSSCEEVVRLRSIRQVEAYRAELRQKAVA
jgi:hypothetical protein